MILSLKITAILPLLLIAIQDFKERKVLWFLFPVLGVILGVIHFFSSALDEIFLYHVLLNCILVTAILSILYLATILIFKKQFLNQSFGLGDVLFFYAFALGFPTISFIVLFANAILFSLLVFLILRKTNGFTTVPLAGLMAVFTIIAFLVSLFVKNPSLYQY
ncbi:hypothetical protein [uncultured Croceitalea sp.]|uniref:hypothetical protein n=1 Tax=uncultured Croceitalea sp. TaxID=1798908 RepID=UPI003306752D